MNPPAEHGQATVEAALVLPVVLIALLLIVQVGIVVRDALALAQAAREGARAAAVTARDADAHAAVERSAGPLDGRRIEVEITPRESERSRAAPVTVRLSYVERLSVPIVSRILSVDLPLRASATMRLERGFPTPRPSPTSSPTPDPDPAPDTDDGREPDPEPEQEPVPEPTPGWSPQPQSVPAG